MPRSIFHITARRYGPSSGEVGRFGFAPWLYASLLINGVVTSRCSFFASGAGGVAFFSSATNSSKVSASGFEHANLNAWVSRNALSPDTPISHGKRALRIVTSQQIQLKTERLSNLLGISEQEPLDERLSHDHQSSRLLWRLCHHRGLTGLGGDPFGLDRRDRYLYFLGDLVVGRFLSINVERRMIWHLIDL